MIKQGKKDNSKRRGIPAQEHDKRRLEAYERQDAYDKLTVAQKIAKLDAGGFTATKQRAKLQAALKKGDKNAKQG